MNETYAHPPLQEALCEFRFVPDEKWDATTLGLIYGYLKGEYTKKQPIMSFAITLPNAESQIGPSIGTEQLIRFLDESEQAIAQLAPNHLIINRLRPYPGWEIFRPQILRGLEAYRAIIPNPRLQIVTLRYINRIPLPTTDTDLSQLFTLYPSIGVERLRHYASFMNGLQVNYADGRDVLGVVLTSPQEIEQRASSIIFDLSYHLRQPDQVSFEQLPDWIDAAHIAIEDIFEACITERLRATFREEQIS